MRVWMFSILLIASSALAAPPGATPPTLSPPSATPPIQPPAPVRVSHAIAMAHEQTRTIAVCDCEESVHQLDDAIAPAIALLDEVIGGDDPAGQVVALHGEGELYTELADRVLAAVPAVPPGSSEDATALHALRVQLVQPLIQPWLDRAREKFAEVGRIATLHPQLAKNATADPAIRDSQRRR